MNEVDIISDLAILSSLTVNTISRCNCGAVTIEGVNVDTEAGFDNSLMCSDKLYEEMKEKYQFVEAFHFTSCNHCVNNWGLDLCACGSGEIVGECYGGFSECNTPMQMLGE